MFQYWHDHAQSFDAFAVTSGGSFNVARGDVTDRVRALSATAEFFEAVGVNPAEGRAFLPEECLTGARPVAVISHGFWQRAFGGSPDAIGAALALNDRPFEVIGVMPEGFVYEPEVDILLPLQLRVDPRDRGRNYTVIGRLKPGVTLAAAQAETDRLVSEFQPENPRHLPKDLRTLGVIRYQDFLVADLQPLLLVILGAVTLVLLIACGNVANLLLSRSTARQRDVAIRAALGASRHRLIRSVLTESLILSLAGGAVGVALAVAGVRALVSVIPGQVPRLDSVTVDVRVLGFALAVSLVIGLAFAFVGAARLLKTDPGNVLKAAAGSGIDRARQRLSNVLVVVEVALSVILLVGASLLIATFMTLRDVPLGFDTENILTIELPVTSARYRLPEAGARLDKDLIEQLVAIPGVASVTTASSVPLERGPNFIFGPEGEGPDSIAYMELRPIGPDYFKTLGIPIEAGRGLVAADSDGSNAVVVVNDALATRLGGPRAALGHRVIIGRTTPNEYRPREIVGVVSNVADGQPGTKLFPTMYVPRSVVSFGNTVAVLVRTNGPIEIAPDIRRVVKAIDPQLPVTRVRSMAEVAASALTQQRFNMTFVGAFAATALLLAMVGLYGLLSYHVAQRTREIGIRVALGARRADVLAMIVRRGLVLTAIGLTGGVVAALSLARFLTRLLFGVSASSPWVLGVVAVALFAVALLASVIPARRAMNADPLIALRTE